LIHIGQEARRVYDRCIDRKNNPVNWPLLTPIRLILV
jgi:hypothetical protein